MNSVSGRCCTNFTSSVSTIRLHASQYFALVDFIVAFKHSIKLSWIGTTRKLTSLSSVQRKISWQRPHVSIVIDWIDTSHPMLDINWRRTSNSSTASFIWFDEKLSGLYISIFSRKLSGRNGFVTRASCIMIWKCSTWVNHESTEIFKNFLTFFNSKTKSSSHPSKSSRSNKRFLKHSWLSKACKGAFAQQVTSLFKKPIGSFFLDRLGSLASFSRKKSSKLLGLPKKTKKLWLGIKYKSQLTGTVRALGLKSVNDSASLVWINRKRYWEFFEFPNFWRKMEVTFWKQEWIAQSYRQRFEL